jgi:hypothetical protein
LVGDGRWEPALLFNRQLIDGSDFRIHDAFFRPAAAQDVDDALGSQLAHGFQRGCIDPAQVRREDDVAVLAQRAVGG